MAITNGHLPDGLDEPIVELVAPILDRDVGGAPAGMRMGDLLSMRSGLACGLDAGEAELGAMRASDDWVSYALGLPMAFAPGTRFAYCSPNAHLLSAVLSASTSTNALDYATAHLFGPLDITDVH